MRFDRRTSGRTTEGGQVSRRIDPGGIVIDGTGASAFRADVRITDGKIVEIGSDLEQGDEPGAILSGPLGSLPFSADSAAFMPPMAAAGCLKRDMARPVHLLAASAIFYREAGRSPEIEGYHLVVNVPSQSRGDGDAPCFHPVQATTNIIKRPDFHHDVDAASWNRKLAERHAVLSGIVAVEEIHTASNRLIWQGDV